MTDEELDLLASAYVDGEATPDEVAMVERDPELQARVEIFRSVTVDDAAATPPAGLVDRHLAAAMAEFDAIGGADQEADDAAVGRTAPVVDLRDATRRADRAPTSKASGRAGTARRADRSNSRPARTMPSWLPAAAGFVIVGGGFLWAVGQTGGDDDSADTEAASVAADDSTEAAEADFDAAEDSGEDGDAAAMSAMSDEAMEESDDAMADEEAMAEDEAEEADRSGGADSAEVAPADGDTDDESAEDAEAELVELEPLLFFDEIPDVDDIDELPEPEIDIERSLCGPEIITTTLGEFVGFIPVIVEGLPAEIYLFVDGDGAEIRLLIDEDCQPIEP